MKKWLVSLQHSCGIFTKKTEDHVGIFIPNRQVSFITSIIAVLLMLAFVLGYFWGHRRAIQRFIAKIEEESFADRINYALYTMNDRDISEFEQEHEDTNGQDDANGADDQDESSEETDGSSLKKEPESLLAEASLAEQEKKESTSAQEPTTLFLAPLAGFGTLPAATEFAQRVTLFDPHVTVQKRSSRSTKGRMVTWYQVTTGEFEKREELQKLVALIQEKEHIKKIDIIEKRKG